MSICTCSDEYILKWINFEDEEFIPHSITCEQQSKRKRDSELNARIRWLTQEEPCDGQGYAHGPHGGCPGYSTDRT